VSVTAEKPSPVDKLYATGKPKPCKYRGQIEGCFGTFPTNGYKLTCDNLACKKELRAETRRPAARKYAAANRGMINARRKRNFPAKKGRINELRRAATYANRKLKTCKITTITDAKLPTAFLRATFAAARKICLGEFYPTGKQQTCPGACSEALAKLGGRRRQQKYNASPKGKIRNNTTKQERRVGNKAKGLPPDAPKGFREIKSRDIKCEYCGRSFTYDKPGQAPLACPKPKCEEADKEHKKELRREAERRRLAKGRRTNRTRG
jgi:hypothetical protein